MNPNAPKHRPEILAPAGDPSCLLAAVAAGTDAVYLGLKHFSARMQAKNFSIAELSRLSGLCAEKGVRLYVAMNVMAKPGEPADAGRLVDKLARFVRPSALIVSDLGVAAVARQAGYEGEIHLSTLGCATHPAALEPARSLGFSRVILPRELSEDEVRLCAAACPEGLGLEVFVHGALCYGVSGRCYWSSMMGGKSGLRGRCVQPCRRVYSQGEKAARFFSCMDLGLEDSTRTLLSIPQVVSWKIEGRKKGPHYVYHVTRAYRLLRDHPGDPSAAAEAGELLRLSLGRVGTRYRFPADAPENPVAISRHTGSGLYVGKVESGRGGLVTIATNLDLSPGDLLRVGFEDLAGHALLPVSKKTPKGRITFSMQEEAPSKGSPVFLIDRRTPEITGRINSLSRELERFPASDVKASTFAPDLPRPPASPGKPQRILLGKPDRNAAQPKGSFITAIWLSSGAGDRLSQSQAASAIFVLPPVIWPRDEQKFRAVISAVRRKGGRRFMLNAPWQTGLFDKKRKGEFFLAGPFCNVGNGLAAQMLQSLGFDAAVASAELSREDYLKLPSQSPIPLGVVIRGFWPLSVSRIVSSALVKQKPFASPRKETAAVIGVGPDTWVFSDRPLDLSGHENELARAGYRYFLHLHYPAPGLAAPPRPFPANWNLKLL
ncbi:MAG: peptidase U32 family protein [Thermodesulfobacteriota bacterium]